MKHLVKSNTYHGHLLQIGTLVQSEPDLDFSWVDVERILLRSIEEVQEEVRRRYQNVAREPICVDSGTDDDPQLGCVYCYDGQLSTNDETKTVPHQDWVRVYELHGETLDPSRWQAE